MLPAEYLPLVNQCICVGKSGSFMHGPSHSHIITVIYRQNWIHSICTVFFTHFYDKTLSDAPTTWESSTEQKFSLFSMLNRGHLANVQFNNKSPRRQAIILKLNQLLLDRLHSIGESFRKTGMLFDSLLAKLDTRQQSGCKYPEPRCIDIYHSDISSSDLHRQTASFINPYCSTDVLIFGIPNMHRQNQKMIQLSWILLSDIHKHLEDK